MIAGRKRGSCGVSKLGRALCAGLLAFSVTLSHAGSCEPVAGLVVKHKADLQHVSIKRHPGATDADRIPPTVLCADDEVSLAGAKGVSVIIRYRSNPPGDIVLSGDAQARGKLILPVLKANNVPSNAWGAFVTWFLDRDDGITRRALVTRGPRSITSPLSRGEDHAMPYYFLPDIEKIHFFWRGGQAPWTLEVTDAQGNMRTSLQTEIPEAAFRLVAKAGERLTLSVRSADERRLVKPIEIVPPTEELTNLPLDSWSRLFPLMAAEDKNWRLYIWNVVRQLPDSDTKRVVMDHLRNDDI